MRPDPAGDVGHELALPLGAIPQAVVDVHGGDAAPSSHGQHEQSERVGPSRHGTGDLGPRCREPAPSQKG